MSEYFRLDKYKSEFELLFPTAFLDDNWELLIQNHLVNQEFWRIQTLEIGLKRIKYLLICEAPPFSHVPFKYFYNGHASSLLTRVWKSFFPNTPIPRDLNKAYLALSSQGFLLVDSLPFALPYKTDIRKKSAYLSLISQYLADWTKAINDNFIVEENLQIAFGFKINALKIIESVNYKLKIGEYEFLVGENNIAADGSGMPISIKIKNIFNLQ